MAEVARELARRHAVSERQARRYAEQARDSGSMEVPRAKMVFTVKLPIDLVKRLKRYSVTKQVTLSSLVAEAIDDFFARVSRRMGGGG